MPFRENPYLRGTTYSLKEDLHLLSMSVPSTEPRPSNTPTNAFSSSDFVQGGTSRRQIPIRLVFPVGTPLFVLRVLPPQSKTPQ